MDYRANTEAENLSNQEKAPCKQVTPLQTIFSAFFNRLDASALAEGEAGEKPCPHIVTRGQIPTGGNHAYFLGSLTDCL